MLIHTHVSAPKRFAKFDGKNELFVGKKDEKVVSHLRSDRL